MLFLGFAGDGAACGGAGIRDPAIFENSSTAGPRAGPDGNRSPCGVGVGYMFPDEAAGAFIMRVNSPSMPERWGGMGSGLLLWAGGV